MHLQRCGARFNAVKIHSSFYRPHQNATDVGWADSRSEPLRFSVRLPRSIMRQQRLAGCAGLLNDFLAQAGGLADEPHAGQPAGALIGPPGRRFCGLGNVRLRGSLRLQHSAHDHAVTDGLVAKLRLATMPDAGVRCLLDNTTEGTAIKTALNTMQGLVRP